MGCKSSKAALRNGLEVAVDVVDQVDATAVTANAKSSKNIEDVEFVFFDLDDTLYQNGYKTERMLTKRIGEVSERLFNLTEEVIFALYQEHGTTIRGLIDKDYVGISDIQEALLEFHDVDLSDVRPASGLREMIESVKKRRFIFTASIREHAERCLERLGIEDLFEDIIDAHACEYYSKHSDHAFKTAMQIAGAEHHFQCILLDDSMRNITTAHHLGWHTVCVGMKDRNGNEKFPEHSDFHIDTVLELPDIIPQLFAFGKAKSEPEGEDNVSVRSVDGDDEYPDTVSPEASPYFTVDVEVEVDGLVELDMTHVDVDVLEYLRVIFVVGGPGSGKGTLCARLTNSLNLHHISAGDLLRKAKNDSNNPHAEEIKETLAAGTLIPSHILVDLIVDEMKASGGRNFLLDGFPRSEDNMSACDISVHVGIPCNKLNIFMF
mmetsp:Transcript_28858/g.35523  ORF Transcript_28858/g.35523 Transcript_28858/m.35523 type:complete len:435 (-) Transcript_28858:231-1535(-)